LDRWILAEEPAGDIAMDAIHDDAEVFVHVDWWRSFSSFQPSNKSLNDRD
jgi:hypothetical protein